ncbi:hypothetical protein EK904_002825 [Melospiza melodia maxima]|nr:hypothetical protein EK904_002825 [Melospiza melodia maxima]
MNEAKSLYPSYALPGQSGGLAEELWKPVGQKPLHPSSERSLHAVFLDCGFHVYNLHQKNGFTCMLIGEIFELMQFIFVVAFTTFLISCVDYDILFANKALNHSQHPTEPIKVTLPDAFLPPNVCSARIQANSFLICILVIAGVFWIHRLVKFIYNICCYWEIHSFYINALKIPMSTLPYYTWQEVQARIVQIQKEHQICIHKKELTELDIYHRILRFKNYMVAMVNKSLLPIRFRLPLLGDTVFYTRGLNYTEILKREPGSLGARCWSLYGRCYLRHFNELDHELHSRLSKGYKPASKYMNCFISPLLTIVAKNVAFFAGSILAVLIALTIYDEDVLAVEHVLTTVTLLGVGITVCRSFIPDQHLVFCPEQLLRVILAHIHYMPDHWQGNAHRYETRDEFAQLFQYKAVFILEELLSPIITPLILIICLRPKSLDIVDFFRNFTVEVVGVGDTCSFAQMDVRQHGHPAPHSLIANVIAGSSALGFHMSRDGQASRHLSEVASALRSFSPLQSAQQPSSGFQASGREGEGAQPRGASAMTASGGASSYPVQEQISVSGTLEWRGAGHCGGTWAGNTTGVFCGSADARTVSSGSSAWEGQLQSMILSEYASTEMSLHALYMHEVSNPELGWPEGPGARQAGLGCPVHCDQKTSVHAALWRGCVWASGFSHAAESLCFGLQLHKQHAQLEPERHTWHRRESDESGESAHEELDTQRGGAVPIPRSASYPFSSPRQPAEETATLQTGFQRRYGGITDPGTVHRAPSHFSRLPLGGWAEDGQSARHPEPVPEESSEDELPPQIHKV